MFNGTFHQSTTAWLFFGACLILCGPPLPGIRFLMRCVSDCAHRKSPGVLTEIPHPMAGSVYRLAGAGGGSAEGVCGGVVVA
jgi:hypothetical protein